MDLVRLRIPYDFIRQRTRLSWRAMRFGLVDELVDPDAPLELAVDQVNEIDKPSSKLLELAGMSRGASTKMLVDELAEAEIPCPEDELREVWLYLALAWIYEHRHEYSDPLQRVEDVYAVFG